MAKKQEEVQRRIQERVANGEWTVAATAREMYEFAQREKQATQYDLCYCRRCCSLGTAGPKPLSSVKSLVVLALLDTLLCLLLQKVVSRPCSCGAHTSRW